MIAENPEIQTLLREDRSKIPAFVEETLRTESPVKYHFRMARTPTSIGDTKIPAGSTVTLLPGASYRDTRKLHEPNEFRIDRPNVREHVAFGRVPADSRRYTYEPTWQIRGLTELHLGFTPIA